MAIFPVSVDIMNCVRPTVLAHTVSKHWKIKPEERRLQRDSSKHVVY